MKIRKVRQSDLTKLGKLIVEHADYEKLPIGQFVRIPQLKVLIFSQNPSIFVWIVEGEQELLGYMSATIDYSTWEAAPFTYLDCLYLKEKARRQGVGIQLMVKLREFAQNHNCKNIQWQTPPSNSLGRSFYRKIGALELPKVRFTWPANTDAE
jgi:ribosomal protein S18 acetylase RimI-like enzyme